MKHDCRYEHGWSIRLFLHPGRTRSEAYVADFVEWKFCPQTSAARLKKLVDGYLKTLPSADQARFTVEVHHVASRRDNGATEWVKIYALTVRYGNRPVIVLIEPLFNDAHADWRS